MSFSILWHSHYLICTLVQSCECLLPVPTSHVVHALIKVSCLHSLCVGAPSETGTFIGVGVGASAFFLLSVLTLVAIILVVVVVRRKVTYKQKGDSKVEDNPMVAKQENEGEEKGLGAGHDYDHVDKNEGKVETADWFDPYEDVDGKAQIKTAMKQAPKESSTPVSVTNIGDLYAVVDKSQKKGAEKEKEAVTNKEDLYAMPMKRKGKLTEKGEGVVETGGMEKGEKNDITGVMCETKADRKSVQQIEGDSKALNVEMLYAVVDKSHKKKNKK